MENNEEEKVEINEKEENQINDNAPAVNDPEVKSNKKIIIIVLAIIILLSAIITIILLSSNNNSEEKKEEPKEEEKEKLKELPLPEVTGGERGKLGIDKNINESNIDEYLNRSDSVYRDMRMLDDPATYEKIGGDRFLSGYIKGFEVVPLPYLIPVDGLPEEVGKTYSGKTLFDIDEEGNDIPNYEESMSIIEELFPKDKVIFLMCGGGGYAGMTKAFLVSLGWDETKIYNAGGFWYYDGNNKLEVTKTENGFDFSDVPYHEIKFDNLKEIVREVKIPIYIDDKYYNNNIGKGIEKFSILDYDGDLRAFNEGDPRWEKAHQGLLDEALRFAKYIDDMMDNRESFILSVYPTETCFSDAGPNFNTNMSIFAIDNNLYFYNIGLLVYKQTNIYKQIKYAPTVIIVYKGKVLAYLDAESDEDSKCASSQEEFNKWITKYIHTKK